MLYKMIPNYWYMYHPGHAGQCGLASCSVSVHISFAFSRTMLQCLSNAFTRAKVSGDYGMISMNSFRVEKVLS
jgi:hypothetical protein